MAKRVVFNLEAAKRTAGVKATIVDVDHPTKKLPPCAHCRKKKLAVQIEYVQEGMWWSDFLIICTCKVCGKATIFVHQSEDESNV